MIVCELMSNFEHFLALNKDVVIMKVHTILKQYIRIILFGNVEYSQ